MFRRFFILASVVIVLALTNSVWAVAYIWDGEDANNYWNAPNNWDPNGIPDSEDTATIGLADPCLQPVIGAGTDANCSELTVGGTVALPLLTIESGSTLSVIPGTFGVGGWGGADGNCIMNGGDITCARMWVGYQSKGVFEMKSGSITCTTEGFDLCRGDDEYGGEGYFHLDGGTLDAGPWLALRMRVIDGQSTSVPGDPGFMDITGGTLIVNYWHGILGIQNYFDDGWLTAYGVGVLEDGTMVTHERARLVMDFDQRNPGRTTVTAYKTLNNGEPYDLYPVPYATGVDPTVTLSWKPGDYVGTGGDPCSQQGNGHHVFIFEGSGEVGWNLMYPVGTQFGHIVGAQDANFLDISADHPDGSLKLGTEYAWTVIEANDANGVPDNTNQNISWWKAPLHYFRTLDPEAYAPVPADGSTLGIKVGVPIPLSTLLEWQPGYYVSDVNGHVVYFGTDFNDVNEANTLDPEYIITRTEPNYTATDLEFGKEYFWRVDEVNTAGPDPCIWPGDTWSFTVGEYRVIDDFDYASWDDMNDFWQINKADYDIDCSPYGGGAGLALAGGAMAYTYNNNNMALGLDYFSEVRYVFPAEANNLTEGDAETTLRALSLDHVGNADNATDPNYDRMYVGLESSDGSMAIVSNPDAIAQENPSGNWNIDLDEFIDAGVDVNDVAYLYLGFGIRCNYDYPPEGGEGVVTFDNIRVYPQRCVGQPGYRQLGDLNGDCTVDIGDVKLLSNAWLETDSITGEPVAVAPNDPCMMARWEFEDNWDNDPNARIKADSNGIAHGTPVFVPDETRPQSLAGNKVAYFDHVDVNDYVICGTWGDRHGDANFLGKSFTLMVWTKQTQAPGWACMISKGEASQKLEYAFPILERQIHFVATASGNAPDTKLDLDKWYHVAGTYEKLPDVNGGISRVYIDGRLHGEDDINDEEYNHSHNPDYDPNWCIGAQDYEGGMVGETPTPMRPHIDRVYYGYLDDVRVYDRQLSEEEIMWLVGKTAPNYYAILPPAGYADIHSPEAKGDKIVNFKDMAKLAQEWLESKLWPDP